MKKFVNFIGDELFFTNDKERTSIECKIVKNKCSLKIIFHPKCSYIDQELFLAATKRWKNKHIRIAYDLSLPNNEILFDKD